MTILITTILIALSIPVTYVLYLSVYLAAGRAYANRPVNPSTSGGGDVNSGKDDDNDKDGKDDQDPPLPSFLIPSYTSHARLLPTPSRHTFTYPLIYLGVDVGALENGSLDLPGRVFRYGNPWKAVLGLRAMNYLGAGAGSAARFSDKVDDLLRDRMPGGKGRVWMVSMPSLLGFEGINPLTVWYVYERGGGLGCIILEVHNTFGETHAYVLPTSSSLATTPNPGYHHAWVFPRSFHVSPFNSRNGYYRLDILDPFPSAAESPDGTRQPRVMTGMKVFLRLLTPEKTCKLTAVVASHPIHQPIPLTPRYCLSILSALVRWPLALVASTPRILYHAYVLHYLKSLAMYPRPEPRQEGQEGVWNPPQNCSDGLGIGLGWQGVATSETWLRGVISQWAANQATTVGIGLEIHFRDTSMDITIAPPSLPEKGEVLAIRTSDPAFFTHLITSPSPAHFVVTAPEQLTRISDRSTFLRFFTPHPCPPGYIERLLIRFRRGYFHWLISLSLVTAPPHLYYPTLPTLTANLSTREQLWVLYLTLMRFVASWAEERIMYLISARFVPGSEPWKIWEGSLKREYAEAAGPEMHSAVGREDADKLSKLDEEGWEDLGSVRYRGN